MGGTPPPPPLVENSINIFLFFEPFPFCESKFEVRFILGPLVSPELKIQDPKTNNRGFSNQEWHHHPDISLYLNLKRESKFDVSFILGDC